MNRFAIIVFIALLAGCQPNQSVVEPKRGGATSKPDSSNEQAQGKTPSTTAENVQKPPAAPETVKKQIAKQQANQAKPVQVAVGEPGTNSWKAASLDPVTFAGKLDNATKNWKQIAGSFEMTLQNTQVKGQQVGTFMIEDNSLYKIEYVDIEHPTGPNLVRADGQNRVILHGKDPMKKTPVAQQGSAAEVKRFYTLFSRQVFETFTEGRPTWKPIMENLSQEGFKITLESKNMESGGVMRPFYRLIATKPGIGLNAFEARFDGIRLVPLTMKMNATDPKGKPIVAEWRSIWNFNQKVKDKLVAKKP